jgi:LacI family transcriptional regulator
MRQLRLTLRQDGFMSPPGRRRRIGLVLYVGHGYTREILEGIADVARRLPHWQLHHFDYHVGRPIVSRRLLDCDGVITTHGKSADSLVDVDAPVVNIAGDLRRLPPNSVLGDDRAIGEAAAYAFRSAGHRRAAAVLSGSRHEFEVQRVRAFRQVMRREGRTFLGVASTRRTDLAAWFAKMTPPVALFLSQDNHWPIVLDALAAAHRAVPDDVSVIGGGAYGPLCDLFHPTLSSVDGNLFERGRAAAEHLERLMDGTPPRDTPLRIRPLGVVERESSNALAVADPDVAAAVLFLRRRLGDEISIDDVAGHVNVSRSTIERRFRETLGRTVTAELLRLRLQHARQLLQSTNLDTLQVALHSGFASRAALSKAFRRHLQLAPTDLRRR